MLLAGRVLGLPELSASAAAPSAEAVWSVWSAAVIKAAFKRLALLTHPDMATGNAGRFQTVARAYDLLMHSRHAYYSAKRTAAADRPWKERAAQ